MQNCHRQLKDYWSIAVVIAFIPILLFATTHILPTHDDWASTTSPDFTPFFTKEHFLFYGYHWRPFDTWIGYIAGRNPQLLYPAFNHCLVVIGHTLCTMLVCRLLIMLGFKKTSVNIATLFFFIAPATMATVLAVDSQNQIFTLIWGIIAFMAYVKIKRYKYIIWPLLIFISTLSKENGLMWAIISPLLAFGLEIIDQKTLKKDFLIGLTIIFGYFVAIAILPKHITIHPDYNPEMLKIVKNVVKFGFSTFITVDYVYLLHPPKRNLLLAIITLLMTIPFFYYIYLSKTSIYKQKKTLCILLCLLIAVAPHLLTIFSMMHTYAGLPFIALLIACSIDSRNINTKPVMATFILFILSALMINTHLTIESIKSGLTGKKMAMEVIRKTGKPVKNVYLIIIEEDFTKLSSFCTVPYEAFGWGLAAKYETNYKWPETICDTTIERTKDAYQKASIISRRVLQNKKYDCVWIIDHENTKVVR